MGTIDIGIRHNDNLVISQFRNVKILMDSGSKSCNHRFDLFICINFIQPCLLHIEDFTS